MSIIAEFSIPPEALPGGDALAEVPETVLELERIVPTQEGVLPFFWVWSETVDAFLRHVRTEAEIAAIEVLDDVEQGALVRATWTPDAELIAAIKALNATILEARATADEWAFRIRTDDREGITTFQDTFAAHGVQVTMDRIYSLSAFATGTQYALTSAQRETLIAAYEAGYYDQPRQVTQHELGEEFGVTSKAVSDRLRRGTANLIDTTLLSSPLPVSTDASP